MNDNREIVLAEKLAILQAVPEFRGLSEEALTPLAKELELRVYPPPRGPGAILARLVGLVGSDRDAAWITHPNEALAKRPLSVVVDGQVRLVQTQNGEPWVRALGASTLFNEEGIADAIGHRLGTSQKFGAAPVGRAWVLELPMERALDVLGRDPEKSPVLAGVMRGFEAAQIAPQVVQIMKRDPNLGAARLDDLYALAEGAEVIRLKRGDPLPFHDPKAVPKYFYVVVDGRLVSAPAGLGDPVDVGTRVDTTFPVALSHMIRRKPLGEQLYAADNVTVMAIGADRFHELLYTNTDFFRAIIDGAGVDPLRGDRDKRAEVDIILVSPSPKLKTPLDGLVDLLGEAIASHMYDRTCVLHVLPAGEGPVPERVRLQAPHQDARYGGATAVTHVYVRLDAEGVASVDAAIQALREERAHDQDVAHDVILVDISRLPHSVETISRAGKIEALTRVCYVIDDPEDYVPFSLLLRSLEIATVCVLRPFRDQRPIGLVMEEMHEHLQGASVLKRVTNASKTVVDYGVTRARRRAESVELYARRLIRPWAYSEGSPTALPPWPPRSTRVRFDPGLVDHVTARATAGGAPLRLADWPDSRESINRWARGVTGRRVGVALGGGGAFGYVHASLITLLRSPEYDIPIDLVSGSSFGSVVGSYYVGGDTDFRRLIDHWWLMTAAVSVGIVSTLSMTVAIDIDVGAYDMNDIEISWYPVVTDADTGTEWSLRRGTLGRGVRASGSLPPMAPTIEGVRRLLDGGLVANVPVQVLHDEGAGMIIASNPIPDPAPREPKAPLPIPFVGSFLRSSEPYDRIMDGFRSTLILMRAAGASQERFADLVYAAETRDTTMFRFQDRKKIMAEAERDPERRLEQTAQRAVMRWRRSLRRPPARVQLLESGEIRIPTGLCFMERSGREVFTATATDVLGEIAGFLRSATHIRKIGIHVVQQQGEVETAPEHRLAETAVEADERAAKVVEELQQRGVEASRLEIMPPGPPLFGQMREIEMKALEVLTGQAARRFADAALEAAKRERRKRLVADGWVKLESGDVDLARLLGLEAAALGLDLEVDRLLRALLALPLVQVYALPSIESSNDRLAWSPDGAWLARAGNGPIVFHRHEAPEETVTIPVSGFTTGLSWRPDQQRLVRGSHDSHERVFDVSKLPAVPREIASRFMGTWRGFGVAYSPSGERVLGSMVNGASIWNPDTNAVFEMRHTAPPYWATWNADGSRVATTSEDGRVGLWDGNDGHLVRWLHEGPITPGIAAFSSTGALAVAHGRDVYLWRTPEEDAEPLILAGHHRGVKRVAWSASGETLASSADDLAIRLWDGHTGALRTVVWGHVAPAHALEWHPEHEILASGGHDGRANVWDGETGRRLVRIGGTSGVMAVAWRPQGDVLATGRADGTAEVWDHDARAFVMRRYAGEPPLRTAIDPRDGSRVLTSTRDGLVELWSATNGQQQIELRESDGRDVESVWHPDGHAVAFGTDDTLFVVNVDTMEKFDVRVGRGKVSRIRWSPDGRFISVSGGNFAQVIDYAKREVVKFAEVGAVPAIEWSPDSTRLLIGAWLAFRPVSVWDVTKDEGPVTLALDHRDGVWSVAWSPDGDFVASGSNEDKRLLACRIEGTRLVGTPKEVLHDGAVAAVAWSPDGKRVATASGDRTVRVLDFASGESVVLGKHEDSARCVAWSGDGRYVVSGGSDAVARVWSVEAREAVLSIEGHENRIDAVGFANHDKSVVTVSADSTVRIHLAAPEDVRDAVGETAARRELTADEWAHWMPPDEPRRPTWPRLEQGA